MADRCAGPARLPAERSLDDFRHSRKCNAPTKSRGSPRPKSRRANLHEKRDHRHPRRLRRRSDDQGRRRADLSDRLVRLRQRRPWRRALQPRSRRLSLHPDRQSDQRGAGEARRRPRRRHRGAVRGVRPGRGELCGAQHRGAGHQHRLGPAALRHHAYAVRAHPAEAGHHGPVLGRRQSGEHRKTDRRRDAGGVLRERRKSGRKRLRHRSDGRGRPQARRAADRRQHGRYPDPAQADRIRRRHRGAVR